MLDTALKTCRQNFEELTLIIHKQEKQLRFLETKATNLSMFYFAFQLAIYLSNSNPSAHQCIHWWKLFFLSALIAVVFGLNFTTTVSRYLRIKYEQDRNYIDQGENYVQMARLENYAEKVAESYNSSKEMETHTLKAFMEINEQQHEPDMFAVYLRYAHLGITVSALIGFTVLVLHACTSCNRTV